MKHLHPILPVIVIWLFGSGWIHVQAGESNAALCENLALQKADESGTDAGIAAIKKCLEQSPDRANVHVIHGDLLLKKGAYTEAEKAFDKALSLRPASSAAKAGKGIVLAHQGKLDEAITLLTDSLKLNPEPSFSHYQLGLVYEKQGKQSEALSHYKEGIRIYEQHRK